MLHLGASCSRPQAVGGGRQVLTLTCLFQMHTEAQPCVASNCYLLSPRMVLPYARTPLWTRTAAWRLPAPALRRGLAQAPWAPWISGTPLAPPSPRPLSSPHTWKPRNLSFLRAAQWPRPAQRVYRAQSAPKFCQAPVNRGNITTPLACTQQRH